MLKRISEDLVAAMKNRDKDKLRTLRSIKSALKNREIELKKELDESEALKIIASEVKRREQAIELYLQGGRDDLANVEKQEIDIIKVYLPEPLTEDELRSEVDKAIKEINASSMKDMGLVMKALKESLGNRADGKILSNIVRSKLSS